MNYLSVLFPFKYLAKVLRPSEHIKISKIEKDPNKLESLYQLGLRDAERLLADKQGT